MSLSELPEISTTALLLPLLAIAVVSDMASRRVPNVLVVIILGCGLVAQTIAVFPGGIVWSLGGALLGFLVLLPFYAFGGMGAGDVKLLAAAGSFLGPAGVLLAGVVTLVAGGVLALGVLAWRSLRALPLAARPGSQLPAAPAEIYLPYSLAIFAGASAVIVPW